MHRAAVFSLYFLLAGFFSLGSWWLIGRPVTPGPDLPPKINGCVSYAPFIGDEAPWQFSHGLEIPTERLYRDLTILSERFSCIRIYSLTGMEELPKIAGELGLQVLLGGWVNGDEIQTRKELKTLIRIAGENKAVIKGVLVGNETLLRQEVTGAQLLSYINEVREALPGIPVTYADVWEFWLSHPELAPAVDFITIHILPYWEDEPIAVSQAVSHVRDIYLKLKKAYPDKELFIGETGWPSFGRMREGARPSPKNQALFLRGVVEMAEREGWGYNIIEAFDQPWKRYSEGAVGGYWGLYDREGQDKNVLSGMVRYSQQWKKGAAISLALVFVFSLIPSVWSWVTAALITAGGFLISFQGMMESQTVRNATEGAWAFGYASLAVAVLIIGVRSMKRSPGGAPLLEGQNPAPTMGQTLSGVLDWRWKPAYLLPLLYLAVSWATLIVSAGLLLDGRYRIFPYAGFLVMSVSFWALRFKGERIPPDGLSRGIQVLLFAAGAAVLFLETPKNSQAVLWAIHLIILALALPGRFRPVFTDWMTLVVLGGSWVTFSAIRYFLLEDRSISTVCLAKPAPSWCGIRSFIGTLIYFKFFAKVGILCALGSLIDNRQRLLRTALFFSLGGMVLYGVDLAIWAFIASFLTWHIRGDWKQPFQQTIDKRAIRD